MSVSITSTTSHVSSTSFNPDLDINDPSSTKKGDESLTVSFTVGKENGALGEGFRITLELPLTGEIPINELEQACKDLGMTPLELYAALGGLFQAGKMASEVGDLVSRLGVEGAEAHIGAVFNLFNHVEEAADTAAKSLYAIIEGGNYPDFTDFLKLMLQTAMELRQFASEAKTNALNGEYDLMMTQASNLRDVAQKNYDAALKQIEAEKQQAIFSIVGGCLSFIGAFGSIWGGPAASQAGSSLSQILEGAGNIHTEQLKKDGALLKKQAELLEAANKALDGECKKLQNQQSIAEELRDIAKSLQDMVLKLYQDFMSAQMQVLQHSNI